MTHEQDSNDSEDIERLLLDELSTQEQLSSMKVTLDKLTSVVSALAQQTATQVPQPEMIEGSTQKPAVQQLNAEEFDNVEYHATFDPIAAAQAKRDELTEAEPARSELAEPICRHKCSQQSRSRISRKTSKRCIKMVQGFCPTAIFKQL